MANEGAHSVTVLNTATNKVVTTLPVGFVPIKIAINPKGTTAYVADAGGKSVSQNRGSIPLTEYFPFRQT